MIKPILSTVAVLFALGAPAFAEGDADLGVRHTRLAEFPDLLDQARLHPGGKVGLAVPGGFGVHEGAPVASRLNHLVALEHGGGVLE